MRLLLSRFLLSPLVPSAKALAKSTREYGHCIALLSHCLLEESLKGSRASIDHDQKLNVNGVQMHLDEQSHENLIIG